jgi:hypothetical protein
MDAIVPFVRAPFGLQPPKPDPAALPLRELQPGSVLGDFWSHKGTSKCEFISLRARRRRAQRYFLQQVHLFGLGFNELSAPTVASMWDKFC